MENTEENWLKFVALYLGQQIEVNYKNTIVLCKTYGICDEYVKIEDPARMNYDYLDEISPVILKSLSDLSEEDAVVIAETCYNRNEPEIGFKLVDAVANKDNVINSFLTIWLIDYLRSKGYALSFMNLNIETLISFGWIKLI